MKKNEIIDFVIYWVDGNDAQWQAKRNTYKLTSSQDGTSSRYRDWDNLKYLFRGIERFAPWVHKVYFISDDQVPKWLRLEHPKLVLVNHKDYIPEKYLPTFSSHPIELNIHRIEGLSERFVIFNDDFFLTDEVGPEDFFVNGLPKDILMEYPVMCGGNAGIFSNILVNNFNLIGKYFKRKEYKKVLLSKILSPRYGMYFFYNLMLYFVPYPHFFGALTPHFARPYLKNSFKEVWEKEEKYLDMVCQHKFRDPQDVNIYIFRLWSLFKGCFVPGNILKMGKAFFIREDDPGVYAAIEQSKYKMICLNDDCDDRVFERVKPKIKSSFEKLLPQKSSFER